MKGFAAGVAVLAGVVLTASAYAQDRYSNYPGLVVPEEVVLPEAEEHPSLWFRADQVETLKAKRWEDRYAEFLWNAIFDDPHMSVALPSPPSRAASHDAVRDYYAAMPRIAKLNAFAWVMNGDERRRERAVQALLRAYDGPIYEFDPHAPNGPVDEIYRGTWLQNFVEAYDWVQPSLSPEEDQMIRERLAREASYIYENLTKWAPRPHNHLSKPAWGLASAALALSSHPDAAKWLQEAMRQSARTARYFFSVDGIYREGSHYYLFSLVNLIPFLYHYKNVAGVDLFSVFRPAFEWPLYIRNGRGWMPNIGDAYIKPTPLHLVAGEYLDVPSPLHPAASLGNHFQWSYFASDRGPWGLDSYTGASKDDTLALLEYLTYNPRIERIPPQGSGTIFMDGGQTVFRNDWSYRSRNHRYLLFHGVAWADNHNHYDSLSFIIHAEDQMMASDSGYTRDGYSDPERLAWYATPRAHNVVTADGRAPFPEDPYAADITPLSRYRMDTDFFDFEEKEAPYGLGGTLTRAIAFVGERYFVVADRLDHEVETEYALYLHGGRGAMTGSGNFRLWTYSSDGYGSRARMAAWIFPSNAEFEDHMGEVTYVRGDFAPFPYVEAKQAGAGALFMQVIIPLGPDGAVPLVEETAGGRVIGVRVTHDGAGRGGSDVVVDEFFLQPGAQSGQAAVKTGAGSPRDVPGAVSAAGCLKTDASFAYVRLEAGETSAWMIREGSRLSCGDRLLVEVTGGRLTAALDVSGAGEWHGVVAHVRGEIVLRLPVPADANDVEAFLDDADLEASLDRGVLEVRLSRPGKLVLRFTRRGDT